ncbi:hypothetical protein HPB48_011373 [Haemaphysalis longicornis]|uniref:Peptidase M13 N-terminal domain-containing protein n=1 Tax=Haemaphysalis longicornis TaxID=44386 RepID=A0A9J6GTH0_HAELO|nr:hypothetical protein HPB48_011373 [Haemaphysalis longicornis]
MDEREPKTRRPPPHTDPDGRRVPIHSSMPPPKRPPQPGRGEYQPPSEYSSVEDPGSPGRGSPPDAPDDCSEGSWMRFDAGELQRRAQMPSPPAPSVAKKVGLQSGSLPALFEQSALDLLASSDSSSTGDEPSQQAGDGLPLAVPKTHHPEPPAPPTPSSAVVDKRASLPAHRRQHGTRDSHLPYWDVHRTHSMDDEECADELTVDYVPATLKIYDTESTQEGTSISPGGDDFGTGGEAATAISGGATSEHSPHANYKRGRISWLSLSEDGVRDPPVKEVAVGPTRAEPSVEVPVIHPKKTLAGVQTLPTKPPSDGSLVDELPAAPSPTKNVSDEETTAKPPVTRSAPNRLSTDLSGAGSPDTKCHPSRSQSTTKSETDSVAANVASPRRDPAAARLDQNLEPQAESSQPSVAASAPVLPCKIAVEHALRLQRAPLPRKQPVEADDKSGKVPSAVPYEEKKRASYLNELELHNTVAAKLQRIPMRLLLFDLFLAFLLVIFSQMEMLGLQGNTTATTTTPSEGPALLYERPVCRSAACSAAGTNLFYTLNESADACQSIFDVVCRPWVHETPSTYHRALVGSARLATATVFEETTKFLESRLRKASPSTSQGKLASLYASCRDQEERDRAGLAYFRGLLRRYQLDRWPFGDDHGGLSRPQGALELFTRDTGAEPYFTLRLRKLGNGSILTVGCPLLGLPPLSFISKDADVSRYTDYVGSVLKLVSGPSAALTNVPATVVDFETNFARLHVASCKEGGTYRTKRLRDLVDSKWNWEHFLHEVTEGAVTNDHVQSASWEYASSVTGFIVSNSAAAANYFGWKVVSRLAPYTTTSMEDTYNAFLEATGLETHRPSRRCLTQVNRVLPFAMGRAYAMISPETSTNYQAYLVAHEVARSLDAYMVKDGQPLASEVETLYRKLRSTMDLTMGYPDWVQDEASVDAYYEPVTIGGSYLESHLSAAKVTYQRSFDPRVSLGGRERLMFPEDPKRWTIDPALLSLYDIQDNRFYLLPAVLQPPYYVEGTAHSLNYGGLGFLLARSILSELFSHIVESTVAPLQDSPSLAKSVQLLRARLLKSSSAGANNRSSEALAASIAYLSFQMHGNFRDEQTVEGAETLTPDQIFFIAVARTLCTLARSRYYVRVVVQGSEVDALSEIDNSLMSLPEYRDAFGCNGMLR